MEKINFKKKFGQNFLTDKKLLQSIVDYAEVTGDDVILEIGAGAGALTEQLAVKAKKVVAFEIDRELQPLLSEKFKNFSNVEIIYADFLDFDEGILLSKLGTDFKVVANIPYYITSPLLSKIFGLSKRPKLAIVMVQKEVAERITAAPGKSDYGYFSVFVNANANAKILTNVGREMFTPVPKVDSAIVRLELKENLYEPQFFEFLKKCFMMKRKTLVNNIEKQYSKTQIELILLKLGINLNSRAESLSLAELYQVYKLLNCNIEQ